ncbi:uncharacterized protein TRUGW13939_00373 [Talaromyces rugulosus]|uniref:Carrier domain-containing protein n=1 Tax=Talaromyces rugulosus TaxID=121627 RepID=A0A7H8QIN1_TALRU|nr:uncharacterized protein TRUGW13939_00373 [Talaromyces rugulosus]QKX53295.1 hypothetical protein TRUGW13939_00373 [Talaromyces rugulosus]
MERADEEARRTCWSLDWKPDPSLLSSKELIDLCASNDKATAAASFVELFAHQNPIMQILEAGDVLLDTSQKIRDRLTTYGLDIDGEPGLPLFRTYTITNSGASDNNDNDNDDTNTESSRLIRRKLDTANSLDEQGFTDCHYDFLICNDRKYLLTATPQGLSNINSLLEENAKILLLEEFVVLSKADLNNLEDSTSANRDLSSLSTSETYNIVESAGSGSTIIITPNSGIQRIIAQVLQKRLSSELGSPDIVTLEDINPAQYEGRNYISLLDLDASVFHDISNDRWAAFQQILSTAKSVLWVTKGQGADQGLVSGLGRVIQSEYLDLRFVEVALEASTSKDKVISHILTVLQRTLLAEDLDLETEYREQDGKLCVGRVIETTTVNSMIRSSTGPSRSSVQQFGADSQRALNLSIASPGLLDTLQFEDDPDYALPLGPTDVEIKVSSTGLNFKDIIIAMGQISGNRLGFECSGIVSRAGPQAGFAPGERVSCCTLSGAYKTFVRTDASWVIRLPDNVPYADAASIPLVFATSYYSLVTVARLSENETVLIHSGAGGVGQAAIQIAQRIKAQIFTTVGSPEKKKLIQDLYGIPESHIFNSRDTSFAEEIQKHCPAGVDVVLNSLQGELQEASWKCIAPLGRFVDVGKADFETSRKGLNMKPFLTNVSFSSVDLSVVMRRAKPVMAEIMSAIRDYMTDSTNPISPPQPLQVYQIGDLKNAFRRMASGKSSGKIVLDLNPASEVPIVPSRSTRYDFDPNATYVIGGGLGGLGQTLVDWMVERKARHFILLSRSGAAKNEAAQEMISRHAANGVEINAPSCDVADENAVRSVFERLSQTMPPIKGCIQGSMVLRDGLLSSMSAADWNAVLRPKTQGTLNLAAHLPRNMDFFVLLSSISAISGSRCQANYSAANSYMDALAQELVAQGRRCLSLNLGVIKDVGIAAQLGTNAALRRDGFEGLTTPELLALLDYACDPKCPRATNPQRAQLIAGLGAAMTLAPEHFESVYWTRRCMFRQLQEVNRITAQNTDSGSNTSSKGAEKNFGRLLAEAPDENAAADAALKGLVNKLANLLNLPETDVETRTPLHSFGIDSLVALEIRYWVSKELKTELSIFDIMQAGGLAGLAGVIAQKSEARTKQ